MEMSFKEKSAWISFFSTLLIFGYYFVEVIALRDASPAFAKEAAVALLGKAVILTIIVESIFHGMLAATNRKAAQLGADERDRWIELRANNWGYTVLVVGVFITFGRIITLEFNPDFTSSLSNAVPLLTAHILMFSFILSELVRFGGQIILYRSEA